MSTDSAGTSRPRRRATAADVARRSGVSRATVSYVLNNVQGQTIPPATQERVRAAAADLGYVPSAAAASLRRGHSRIILVVTEPALSGYVTDPFLTAISERFTEGGFVPLTHQLTSDDALRGLIAEIRPYGVLALTALTADVMAEIREAGVPHVYSSAQGDPTFPRPWEEEIGEVQARLLIESGADRLIYAAPSPDNPRSVLAHSRARGVAEACRAAGIPEPVHVSAGRDPDLAAEALRTAMSPDRLSGICAFDDEVAGVILAAIHKLGLQIPAQVKVIGVDDAPFAPFLTPPLTTIAIDGHQTGWSLAERFLQTTPTGSADAVSHALVTVVRRASA
jgi:DNA-binding LacI/PurR family transcriptional regulator